MKDCERVQKGANLWKTKIVKDCEIVQGTEKGITSKLRFDRHSYLCRLQNCFIWYCCTFEKFQNIGFIGFISIDFDSLALGFRVWRLRLVWVYCDQNSKTASQKVNLIVILHANTAVLLQLIRLLFHFASPVQTDRAALVSLPESEWAATLLLPRVY